MTPDDAEPTEPSATNPRLSPADERAVDALIEHGFDIDRARAAHPELADRISAAHRLFARASDQYPVDAPDPALIDATLARIDREEESRSARMRLAPGGFPTLGRGRWADFVAVACVAILAFSIGMPLLNTLRDRSERAACSANLRELGTGLSAYHGDFHSRPIAAGFAPDLSSLRDWSTYDNSKHLDPLAANNYCAPGCLHCAKDAERAGYASQVPNELLNRIWLRQAHVPLVADRNPLIYQTAFGGRAYVRSIENSLDHGGRGQNVLFGDLSVSFEGSPIITIRLSDEAAPATENIWLPALRNGREDGLSAPAEWGALDVFLTQ
jgi:hypothetical protein